MNYMDSCEHAGLSRNRNGEKWFTSNTRVFGDARDGQKCSSTHTEEYSELTSDLH
jgi:hypothetical protein